MGYYSGIAEGYDQLHEEEQLKKIKILEKEADIKGLILDVGAGTCIVAKYFHKKGKQVISLDPSQKLLDQGEGAAILGKAEKLPFKDETFDTVLSVTALHHCNIEKALKEIKRVAKQKATIAISFLKKSSKLKEFEKMFKKVFGEGKRIDEGKDIIHVKN
jgi:ubiquinone/menaquinone biosynthesis C-methylase UbiE|tara:strand:- start:25694 stop:26173 length:480 start_codon:yes stop_codon:yes gene_type:complete